MKRRQVKIRCKAKGCNSQFNSDYRLQHNREKHEGKNVPYETAGAVKNPFEAAKRKKDNPIEEKDSSSSSSSEKILDDKTEEIGLANSAKEESVSNISNVVGENVVDEESESEAENSENDDTDDENDDYWISCAGKLKHLLSTLEQRGNLTLNILTQPCTPNIEEFAISAKEFANEIKTQCNDLEKSAERLKVKIDRQKGSVQPGEAAALIEHDPGKRKKDLSDSQRRFVINLGPYQPRLTVYPSNAFIESGKQNKFSSTWFKDFPHLEYSVQNDAAFCYVCSLFPNGAGRPSSDASWTINGVRQWHKMKSVGKGKKGKLIQHFTSQSHRELRDFARFTNPHQNVDALLDLSRRHEMIKETDDAMFNTKIMLILCDAARTMAMQDLAFRGNTDESSNFHEIVKLISRHCGILKYWQNQTRMRPYHATYMSKDTQNELIKLLGDAVRHRMVKELEEVSAFSVMADTTPDTSNKDQMAIVVRYVVNAKPVERLLCLRILKDKSGEGHAAEILKALNECSVDPQKLVFQSYDFSSCMSGKYKGCQRVLSDKIQEDFPHKKEILYIPCQAHRLSTYVERSSKASSLVSSMFDILQSLYTFFSSSTKRSEALEKAQVEIEGALKMRNLSQTRWIARSESIDSVWISLTVIVSLLEQILQNRQLDCDKNTQDQAKAILKKMKTFDFVFSLATMRFIMRRCKVLVVQLQEEGLILLDALELVSSTTRALEKIRNEDDVQKQIEAATQIAMHMGINPEEEFQHRHRRRLIPRRIDENRDNEEAFSFQTFYSKEIYSVLDQIITDCKENWGSILKKIKPFTVLLPPWDNLREEQAEDLEHLLSGKVSSGSLIAELTVLREDFQEKKLVKSMTVREIAKFVYSRRHIYPASNTAYTFLQTAPITVASNERSFSKLKLVKTKLRSTMLQESLMLISCEKDFSENVNLEDVVKNWIHLKNRRVRFDTT